MLVSARVSADATVLPSPQQSRADEQKQQKNFKLCSHRNSIHLHLQQQYNFLSFEVHLDLIYPSVCDVCFVAVHLRRKFKYYCHSHCVCVCVQLIQVPRLTSLAAFTFIIRRNECMRRKR